MLDFWAANDWLAKSLESHEAFCLLFVENILLIEMGFRVKAYPEFLEQNSLACSMILSLEWGFYTISGLP